MRLWETRIRGLELTPDNMTVEFSLNSSMDPTDTPHASLLRRYIVDSLRDQWVLSGSFRAPVKQVTECCNYEKIGHVLN